MIVFAKLPLVKHLFRGREDHARKMSKRWVAAFMAEPELAKDLIREAEILTFRPEYFEDGSEIPTRGDPLEEMYAKGKRELALRFLALGHLSVTDLNQLIKENDHEHS